MMKKRPGMKFIAEIPDGKGESIKRFGEYLYVARLDKPLMRIDKDGKWEVVKP